MWICFTPWALAQSAEYGPDDLYCRDWKDVQEQTRRLADYDVLKQLDQAKDQIIANLEKENDLLKRESELKDRIMSLKDQEIAINQRAFEKEKELTDRALKLAETAKPSSGNWQLMGILGAAAFALGAVLGK